MMGWEVWTALDGGQGRDEASVRFASCFTLNSGQCPCGPRWTGQVAKTMDGRRGCPSMHISQPGHVRGKRL